MTQDRPVKRIAALDPTPYVGAYTYTFEAFFHRLELVAKDGVLTATSPTLWPGERTWLSESAAHSFGPDSNTSITIAWGKAARVQELQWGSYEFVKVPQGLVAVSNTCCCATNRPDSCTRSHT